MSHYAVIADFTFSGCRPSLRGLSLHSTKEGCTLWPVSGSMVGFSCNKQVFHTLVQARSYITYLLARHPGSNVPFPVLDNGQPDLFQEVSE
jgi:hypothetical protein